MSNKNNKNQAMAKDTIIYMLAKGIEGIVGVLTISAMSYIYIPEQTGRYSSINIAVTTVAMVLIQWLVQSVLRYINKYELDNEQDKFFSTVFFSWFKVNIIVFCIASFLITALSLGFFKGITNVYPISLIIVSFIMFFTYNTSQLIIGMLAGIRKSKINLFLSVINVVGKLFAIVVLNKIFTTKIEWIFISYIIFDFITALIGFIKLDIKKHIKWQYYDKEILYVLKMYGIPLMGNMIATSVLNKSDIYVIQYFLGEDKVGIYQTNYSIIASAFTLLATGAMRGSYPTIIRTWSEGDEELTKTLIGNAIRTYLLISLPAVVGVFCISDFVAKVLFEAKYFEGHSIMGFVSLGMMFLGLTEYAIKPWELNARTKEIFKRSMISGVLNIILNVAFIKIFGYKFAGISTFIAFFLYFILAKNGTKEHMSFNLNKPSLYRIIISIFIMGAIIIIIKQLLPVNIITLCVLIFIGILVYTLCLYFTGEIKNEINIIVNKLKKR
ncbi:oligosaccharide flippase family protein [uncultured Tyzzerella sp.]|uniref:oligosaccharide flippase family protein n=1 Tax=uncultured Tyzzerella sp. TaxID=2321398 RepID=UPI002942DD59|nr:oligosaccharide flippase family protein [uncultured Tyzzerella sp.]